MDWEWRFRRKEGKGRTDSSGQTDINIPYIERAGNNIIRQLMLQLPRRFSNKRKPYMHVLTMRSQAN